MPKAKAAPKTAAKKAAGQKYQYQQLAQVGLASGASEAHVYGVIVDATFPYKANKGRFICSLKVVDPSLNGAKADDYATVVLYASRFEDLPIVHRVGDVLRVHRASLRLYDDKRQFNVNVQHNGSWALFSTDKSPALGGSAGDNQAFAHSGKRCSFEKHEVQLLASLRKWASTYFSSQQGTPSKLTVALGSAKGQSGDFDVTAKITQLIEFDEYTNELCLKDASGDSWYTLATKLKFPHLKQGQVVRVRSVQADASSTSKQMLTQQHYSNVMTYISGSKAAKALAGLKHSFNAAALKAATPSSTALVLSAVGAKYADMPYTSLRDLFHRDNTLSGTTFRVQLSVLAVQPGDASKMV